MVLLYEDVSLGEKENVLGGMGVANVFAVAVEGNWQYSCSAISLAEILSSLYLSNRKGFAVPNRKQISPAVHQIYCKNPKIRQLFVIGFRAVDI